jgi:hypothetical protein
MPSTPGLSKWSLPLNSPHQKPVRTSPLPHACYMPRPSHSLFDHPTNINRYNILSRSGGGGGGGSSSSSSSSSSSTSSSSSSSSSSSVKVVYLQNSSVRSILLYPQGKAVYPCPHHEGI